MRQSELAEEMHNLCDNFSMFGMELFTYNRAHLSNSSLKCRIGRNYFIKIINDLLSGTGFTKKIVFYFAIVVNNRERK